MLQEYKAISGQSVYDVCTLLYGNCDNIVKLCANSGIEDMDIADLQGVVFLYEINDVSNAALQQFLLSEPRGTNYFTPDAACAIVTGLALDSATTTELVLSWDSIPTSAGYQYALTFSDTQPTTGWTTILTNTVTISGLTSGTTFYFWIRNVCFPGSFSAADYLLVETEVPTIYLWTSPWLNPDVTNPSPGDYMPYAMPPVSIYNGTTLVTLPTIELRTETDEDNYLTYLNSGFSPDLTGTFTRTSGVFKYEPGTGEMPSVFGTIETLYKYADIVYKGIATSNARIVFGMGILGKVVINWDDPDDATLTLVTTTSTVVHNYTHVTPPSGAVYDFRMYHNDKVIGFSINETVSTPVAPISSMTGTMPAQMRNYLFENCASLYAGSPSAANMLTSNMADLRKIQINNTNIVQFSPRPFATGSFNVLKVIDFSSNKLSSTAVDDTLIDFNGHTTALDPGTILLDGQTPAAPRTPASDAAYADLVSDGYSILVDP